MGGLLSRLPLRVRITAWVVAIFAVVHVTLSLVVLLLFRQGTERQVEQDLVEAAQAVVGDTAAESRLGLALQVIQGASAARWGPLACVVVDDAGAMINTAGPYDPSVMQAFAADAAMRDGRSSEVYSSTDGRFLYSMSTLVDGERLAVAAPVGHADRATQPAAIVLLLTLPVGLVAAGVATWYMSGVAVRPLQQVQQFAEELSAENVPQAIEIDEAGPEIEGLRNELEQAMSRIGEGYERQARFLANVSHELKTPISVVRTEADVLLAGSASEKDLREFARSTSEEMDRLGRMVESFLLLTRIRQGTARIRAKRHDANDMLMEAVGHCSGMAEQYGVQLAPTLDPSENTPFIEGNADLIQTALGNLIRNAIRFSPRGERIEASCEQHHGQAVFSVRDFGPGIPEILLGRIFEPFTQADEERRRGRGTGLGLQIAQGIAELHGGRIDVENTDPGCRFRLFLTLSEHDLSG